MVGSAEPVRRSVLLRQRQKDNPDRYAQIVLWDDLDRDFWVSDLRDLRNLQGVTFNGDPIEEVLGGEIRFLKREAEERDTEERAARDRYALRWDRAELGYAKEFMYEALEVYHHIRYELKQCPLSQRRRLYKELWSAYYTYLIEQKEVEEIENLMYRRMRGEIDSPSVPSF